MKPVRLLILSDLHLEFARFEPPDPDTFDIAVLAGDIATGTRSVIWPQYPGVLDGRPVVLVPGNHEFYRAERVNRLLELREEADGTDIHVLDRDEAIIDGVRFLGCTLWTDFELDVDNGLSAEAAMRHARRGLNDFIGAIREREPGGDDLTKRCFTPEDSLREHNLSRAWLLERLAATVPPGVIATVVVTHHSPSARSIHPMYQGGNLNACFHSELPKEFFGTAALWIHGHTHSSADYVHHGTRIMANPRGYTRWDGSVENPHFDPSLVVELQLDGGADAS